MAIPVEPATSAIFRALRSVDVDPDLAYEAAAKPGKTSSLPSEPRSPRSGPRLKLKPRGLTFSSG